MEKHIIFFDLDGTLLSTMNELSEQTIEVVHHLSTQGHIIVLCTGRQLYSSLTYYDLLKLKSPLITLNGATIYNTNQELLFHAKLPESFTALLTTNSLLKEIVKVYDFEIPNLSIVSAHNTHLLSFLEAQMSPGEKPNITQLQQETNEKIKESSNIYAFLEKKDFDKHADEIFELIPDDVGYRMSGDNEYVFFEFYPQSVNKATGIEFVLDMLNTDHKYTTMAFGDGTNDIDMLGHVSHGVAMKNGCSEAHDISDCITKYPNTDSGVAAYLIEYFNLEQFK